MTTLDEHADRSQVELALGDSLAVRLEENPTTGFRWRVDADGAPAAALAGDEYQTPARGTAGAPGHHLWRFRAATCGTATIQLSYRRLGGAPARTFTLTVEVR
jgi:inhibitor of cysteine peptidase